MRAPLPSASPSSEVKSNSFDRASLTLSGQNYHIATVRWVEPSFNPMLTSASIDSSLNSSFGHFPVVTDWRSFSHSSSIPSASSVGIQKDGIAGLPLFAGLSEQELTLVLANSGRRIFRQQEVIKDPRDAVLVTIEGKVRCALKDVAGGHIELESLPPGSIIGEKKYAQQSASRTSTDPNVILRADHEVAALVIPREVYESVLLGNSKSSAEVLRQVEGRLDQMNRLTLNQMVSLDFKQNHQATNLSDRAADFMTRVIGSWKVLVGSWAVCGAWMGAHGLGWVGFDPYPFIFLNLAFSAWSSSSASIVLKSQNRQNDLQAIAQQSTDKLIQGLNTRVEKALRRNRRKDRRIEALVSELAKKREEVA